MQRCTHKSTTQESLAGAGCCPFRTLEKHLLALPWAFPQVTQFFFQHPWTLLRPRLTCPWLLQIAAFMQLSRQKGKDGKRESFEAVFNRIDADGKHYEALSVRKELFVAQKV